MFESKTWPRHDLDYSPRICYDHLFRRISYPGSLRIVRDSFFVFDSAESYVAQSLTRNERPNFVSLLRPCSIDLFFSSIKPRGFPIGHRICFATGLPRQITPVSTDFFASYSGKLANLPSREFEIYCRGHRSDCLLKGFRRCVLFVRKLRYYRCSPTNGKWIFLQWKIHISGTWIFSSSAFVQATLLVRSYFW